MYHSNPIPGLVATTHTPRPYRGAPGRVNTLGMSPDPYLACGITTHCYRSISQRGLTFTRRLCANLLALAGSDLVGGLVGVLGITTFDQTGGVPLFNADNALERQQTTGLVWLATRAGICTSVRTASPPIASGGSPGSQNRLQDWDGLERALGCYMLSQLGLSWYNSSDRRDPYVEFENLLYFSRPDGGFVPHPAMYYPRPTPACEDHKDRDPSAFLEIRPSFNTDLLCALQSPAITTLTQIIVEIDTLWVPDPRVCGNDWPGHLCDKTTIIPAGVKTSNWLDMQSVERQAKQKKIREQNRVLLTMGD